MKNGALGEDIGKYKILLDRVSSTHWFALELLRAGNAEHGTMVTCLEQTHGKGRLDKSWDHEKSKNIAINFILNEINAGTGFTAGHLSMVVALAVCFTSKATLGSDVRIKWPNDIISQSKKIAGILITNQWRGSQMESCVIGIGININKVDFTGIPQAGSFKSLTGKETDVNIVIQTLIQQMNHWYKLLYHDVQEVVDAYHHDLYGYQQFIQVRVIRDDTLQDAKIIEVDQDGIVKLEFKNGNIRSYDLDELKIIF
ncbi:MAG: biotin--[acetyl-CoA-carboxylase] ligase [Saprospiraceae bacterium]